MITGIGVVGRHLIAPNSLNLRIKQYWQDLHAAKTADEWATCTQRLLSQLGTVRHIVGTKSDVGQRTSDQMNMLKQKRDKWLSEASSEASKKRAEKAAPMESEDIPF